MKIMKKIMILALIVLFAGCTTTLYNIQSKSDFFGIDFTKYSQKGFLITPEKYIGEYESIGMIEYKLIPGARYVVSGTYYDNFGEEVDTHTWVVDQIKFSQAIDSIYVKAKSMGANAIMNFDFNIEYNEEFNNPMEYNNPIIISGYRITGFAIKK